MYPIEPFSQAVKSFLNRGGCLLIFSAGKGGDGGFVGIPWLRIFLENSPEFFDLLKIAAQPSVAVKSKNVACGTLCNSTEKFFSGRKISG
ncbi:MAG: hypothetical protein L6W00_28395 [Lentisphaeria bacterium]|nr:MAG: hypothetical protein L6W00_28395 [Lentisphaeria bacterium]